MAEIKTIPELKREIKEAIIENPCDEYQKGINNGLELALKDINSFEAWVRKRIEKLEESNERIEKGVGYEKDNEPYFETDSIEELRRLLEGGGEKEKG